MSTISRRSLDAPEGTWTGDWAHDFEKHLRAASVPSTHRTRARYAEVYGAEALAALDDFHTRTDEKAAEIEAHTQRSEDALARMRAGDYTALTDYREAEAALDAAQYMPTPARQDMDATDALDGEVLDEHTELGPTNRPSTPGDVYETARGVYLVTPSGDWLLSDRLAGDVQRRLKFALRRRLAG